MGYHRQGLRCALLVLLIAVAGLGNSAVAAGFSPSLVTERQSMAIGKSVSCGPCGLYFSSARESKGLSRFPVAYVDPGAGQLVLQMLAAACVGALFYIKRIGAFIRKLVDKWFKKR
jgi:hypothetical protein